MKPTMFGSLIGLSGIPILSFSAIIFYVGAVAPAGTSEAVIATLYGLGAAVSLVGIGLVGVGLKTCLEGGTCKKPSSSEVQNQEKNPLLHSHREKRESEVAIKSNSSNNVLKPRKSYLNQFDTPSSSSDEENDDLEQQQSYKQATCCSVS